MGRYFRLALWSVAALTAGWGDASAASATSTRSAAEDSAWIKLFNGTDLKDWDFKIRGQSLNVDPKHTFKVVEGALFVDYGEYTNFSGEPFGHLAYKLRKFSHYLLRSEYQFVSNKQVSGGPSWAKENNGFMLHSQSMASMGTNQDFPISLEAQLLGSGNGTSTMNLCTPGTHFHDMSGNLVTTHCTNAATYKSQPAPAWTSVSALVLGDSVIKFMAGKDTVLRFTKPVTGGGNVSGNTVQVVENAALKDGYITIQAESAPVYFRKIEVLDLVGCMDKTKPGYRTYFVKNDATGCNVTGMGNIPEARDFEILREGGAVRLRGAGARIENVRNMNGETEAGFANRSEATSFRPGKPGVYLLSIRTATGAAHRKVALF